MRFFRKKLLPILVVAGLLIFSGYLYKKYRIAPDIEFPEVEVVDLNENPVEIKELTDGKLTLLVFWATWCGVCREEIPHLEALEGKFPEDKFQIVMVSDEPIEEIESFISDKSYPFLFLKLVGKSSELEVHKIPTSYLIKDGVSVDDEVGLYDWSGEEGLSRIEDQL